MDDLPDVRSDEIQFTEEMLEALEALCRKLEADFRKKISNGNGSKARRESFYREIEDLKKICSFIYYLHKGDEDLLPNPIDVELSEVDGEKSLGIGNKSFRLIFRRIDDRWHFADIQQKK